MLCCDVRGGGNDSGEDHPGPDLSRLELMREK